MPTLPFSKVYPVPLGVSVTFWFAPPDVPAVKVSAPLPVIEPVAVPVPPLATGTVPNEITGVEAPVATLMGDVPVTEVTVPEVGAVQLTEPAVMPAVKTLPLLLVPVAITCRFPSPVGCV